MPSTQITLRFTQLQRSAQRASCRCPHRPWVFRPMTSTDRKISLLKQQFYSSSVFLTTLRASLDKLVHIFDSLALGNCTFQMLRELCKSVFKLATDYTLLTALVACAVLAVQARGASWWTAAVASLGSDAAVTFCCVYVIPISYFVVIGRAYQALDEHASGAFRKRFKLQTFSPSARDYRQAWQVALVNVTVVTAPFAIALACLVRPAPTMPSALEFFRDIAVSATLEEVLFFSVHAAMHRIPVLCAWDSRARLGDWSTYLLSPLPIPRRRAHPQGPPHLHVTLCHSCSVRAPCRTRPRKCVAAVCRPCPPPVPPRDDSAVALACPHDDSGNALGLPSAPAALKRRA